ncbi:MULTISPECIES: hypothetical protein [Photobacterium]|uniref:hypothetical protein n=1 Tax=Photobacterium TaxID=657 RepID=UPI0014754134|nr:hypothetical protein [Photobacterium indicum]
MGKFLYVHLLGMLMVGCTSTTATHQPDHQFRQQYMELYRTMEMTPKTYPILILQPSEA